MPRKSNSQNASDPQSAASQPRQQSFAGFDDEPPARKHPAGAASVRESQQPAAERDVADSDVAESSAADSSAADGDVTDSNAAAPAAPLTSRANEQDDPNDLTDRLVVIVDSHSLIYQVFHALPPMSSPSGLPVAAVHGFLGDLLELLVRKEPDYLFCAFDKSEKTFRNELYPEYKAHREAMPEDLRQQIPLIHRVVEALGISRLECVGYEADDILAKVAKQVEQAGGRCLVVTGDKDCRQLITDRVQLYNIRKNTEMGIDELWADWGIRPDQVVDYQAMIGDPVDNVPGIPLVGPKLAKQLLEQFDTLENIFANTASISGPKRRQNIEQGQAAALLSRTLVRLEPDFELPISWPEGRVGRVDLKRLEALCDEFGFRRLKGRVAEVLGEGVPQANAVSPIDFSGYRCITDLDELRGLVEIWLQQESICIDTETTSTSPRHSDLVGISVAWEPGKAVYIPVRAPAGDPVLEEQAVIGILNPVLENPRVGKIGQNIKYDLVVLRGSGSRVEGVQHDTMVADYIIEPGRRNHTLDDIALRYLNHTMISIKELIGTGKQQKRMDEVPLELVARYAAEDADVPLQIAPLLAERLRQEGLDELFDTLEMPLIEVLAEMEFNGIYVDVETLQELSRGFTTEIDRLRLEIHALAGSEFNIDSPKQLAVILFEHLGLPVIKKTKTGASTDADVLGELATMHDLPAKVVAYRQAMKLKNTYVDALPQLVCEKTGRIHTSFRQDVAATGRLSSSEPNLQNIPVRNEAGKAIRSAFRAQDPSWLLLGADYSQIELRVLAHYSGDPALLQAYRDDADIHRRVAAEVHGVEEQEVTEEMRRTAKTINFGIVYGQSAFGLARTLGIPKDQAAAYIELYFQRYPGVQEFMLNTLIECRRDQSVKTMLGRRRAVQGVRDFRELDVSKMRSLTEAERIAVNTVIQGSAADLIKQAMLNVYHRLRNSDLPARLLLQIHDELLFEVDPHAIDTLETLVREEMAGVAELKVPLKVDVARGATWAEV
ncbi:DNA polymerase I [Planctomycetaceae bacterium SH139]